MSKAKKPEPVEDTGESVDLGDSACRVYRDRAGRPLGSMMTEGRANFAAITAGAIKSVEDAQKNEQ